MQLDRLYACLEEWRDSYDRSNVESEMGTGYPRESLVIQCGGASSVDAFDNMYDDTLSTVVIEIEAMVDSLSFPQRDAIRHQWLKESKCWPTHEIDYAEALCKLMSLAEKRGLE